MPNNKRALLLPYTAIICSVFGLLLVACSPSSKAQGAPTSITFTSVPLSSTESLLSPTAEHQILTNIPSPEPTISKIATFGKFDSNIQNAVISDDGKILAAVGGRDDRITVWDVVT